MPAQLRHMLQIILPLLLIMLVGSLSMGITYDAASQRIAKNKRELILHEIRAVFPGQHDERILDDQRVISDENILGSRYPVTVYRVRGLDADRGVILMPLITEGYNGPVKLVIGINLAGEITGVRILEHRETPGLGSQADQSESDWLQSFAGRTLENTPLEAWNIKSEGGEFDSFSGASITPRSVIGAVQRSLKLHDIYADRLYQ